MRSVRSFLVVACAAQLVGCAAATPEATEDVGAVRQAITDGTVDDADSAVVALLHAGEVYCTGVLVSPYAVATAGHCVNDVKPDHVFFGGNPKGDGTFVEVSDTQAHAGFDPDTLANDIAIVGLKTLGPAKPVPLVDASAIDASWVGTELKLVGFGLTKSTDSDTGPKRSGLTKIDSVDDATFRFKGEPSQTCSGDSGGPAFAKIGGKYQLVGITSSGDSDCKVYGRDTRVDVNVSFIESYTTSYDQLASAPVENGGCRLGRRKPGGGVALFCLAAAVALFRRRRSPARAGGPSSN